MGMERQLTEQRVKLLIKKIMSISFKSKEINAKIIVKEQLQNNLGGNIGNV